MIKFCNFLEVGVQHEDLLQADSSFEIFLVPEKQALRVNSERKIMPVCTIRSKAHRYFLPAVLFFHIQ